MNNMKKVIITGANGFIGSAVVKNLLEKGIEVIALVHSRQIRDFGVNPLLKVVPFELEEINKLDKFILDRDIDTFYHFAWNGGHADDRNNISKQLQNVEWTAECVRIAKKLGCKKIIGVGTIMEFETYATANAQENRPGMGYIYGGAKLAAHAMCKSLAANIGIDLVWGMLINAYGIGETAPRLINRTIRSILNNEDLNFTDGTQMYDFVYIDDAAEAFYLLGEKGKAFKSYMIGSGEPKPLKEFLELIRMTVAQNKKFNYGAVKFTGIDLLKETFMIDELVQDTGYIPQTSFVEGIIKTMKFLKGER